MHNVNAFPTAASVNCYWYNFFQEETLRDYEAGHLYGLEKFWAYLHYSKSTVEVNPKLAEPLKRYKTLEDFRANVSPPNLAINDPRCISTKQVYRDLGKK